MRNLSERPIGNGKFGVGFDRTEWSSCFSLYKPQANRRSSRAFSAWAWNVSQKSYFAVIDFVYRTNVGV